MAEEDKEKPKVSEAELNVLLSGPAVLANKMYVTGHQAGARITFCEQLGANTVPVFRSAVYIGYAELESLIGLLQKAMERIEAVEVQVPPGETTGG